MTSFEETNYTLVATDLDAGDCDLVPTLIHEEIRCGPSWKFVFRNAVLEVDDLVGVSGDALCVATISRTGGFTARTASEATIDESGLTKDKLSMDSVSISIGDVVYLATRISDILQEDSKLPWVRTSLRKMAQAIWYKLDTDIRDLLVGCAGTVQAASTHGTLSYDDIVDAVATLKVGGYWETPLVFINAAQEADLAKDTRFTDTARYSYADIPMGAEGGAGFDMPKAGKYASCFAFVTDIPMEFTTDGVAYALVVSPPTARYGPAAMLAWKRHMKAESWRDEQEQRDDWSLSTRYGLSCICTDAIVLISDC